MSGDFPRPIRASGSAAPARPPLIRDFKHLLVHFFSPPLDYLTHYDQTHRRTLGCIGSNCLRCHAGDLPRASWYAAVAYSTPSVAPSKDTPAAAIFSANRVPGGDWRPGVLTLPATSISSLSAHGDLLGATVYLVRRSTKVVTIDYAWPHVRGLSFPATFDIEDALSQLLFPMGYAYTASPPVAPATVIDRAKGGAA